jgi:hypothetical protein
VLSLPHEPSHAAFGDAALYGQVANAAPVLALAGQSRSPGPKGQLVGAKQAKGAVISGSLISGKLLANSHSQHPPVEAASPLLTKGLCRRFLSLLAEVQAIGCSATIGRTSIPLSEVFNLKEETVP